MATTRVYILAKELGVKSSAIVKKCQDENLDVKNHMSVISAGLAATIQEWFSEGENVTTVETSEKVDLEKVRIKRKKKAAPVKKVQAQKEAQEVALETETIEEAPSAAGEEQIETVPEQIEEEIRPAEEEILQIKDEPEEEPVQEPEPEPVVPAGPIMEKPEPAKLSGPQVVRVEAPEPIRRRPRSSASCAPWPISPTLVGS